MLPGVQRRYLILRKSAKLPAFDERFVNYGYNKVQLFENLRALSYNFFIWNDIFAMDLPHPDSKFRKSYITGLKVRSSPMKEMYSVFQSELNEKYAMNKPSKVCRTLQRKYYSPVLYSVVCSPILLHGHSHRAHSGVVLRLLQCLYHIHPAETPS